MTDTIWPPDFEKSSESKYIVLVQSLRAAVRSGEMAPGEKLPPVRELAWKLGITPGTVARAYKLAVEEGLLETTVGRGTFVSSGKREEVPEEVSLVAHMASDDLNLRGIRVPDVGQDSIIQGIMRKLGAEGGMGYIDCPTPLKDVAARQAVVRWIGQDRVGRFNEDEVVLGLGAQHTVILTLQACLHGANPIILTEELAFPGVRHAARLLRAQVIGVPMDAEGLRPDKLEEILRQHGGQVLLTAAETHSPTTLRTTLERRREIAEVARRYQLQIIEDDCHTVTRPDLPAYRAICPERAWYVSSLTKSVSAAMRFGFVVCAKGQEGAAQQVSQSSFYGLPLPMLDICAELINSGQAEVIRQRVEDRVRKRVQLALNILGHWDVQWRPDVPFIWIRLPRGWRCSTFMLACGNEGIGIKPADEFALPDGPVPNAVRIGLNPDIADREFEVAMRKLSDILSKPPLDADF